MKAKVYTNNFVEKFEGHYDTFPRKEVIKEAVNLVRDYMQDYEDIRKARNIDQGSKMDSLFNLINEFDSKWKKIVFEINKYFNHKFGTGVLNYTGFLEGLKLSDPLYCDVVKRYKERS